MKNKMIIILPKWYEKAKKSIDENIINIAIKNVQN